MKQWSGTCWEAVDGLVECLGLWDGQSAAFGIPLAVVVRPPFSLGFGLWRVGFLLLVRLFLWFWTSSRCPSSGLLAYMELGVCLSTFHLQGFSLVHCLSPCGLVPFNSSLCCFVRCLASWMEIEVPLTRLFLYLA